MTKNQVRQFNRMRFALMRISCEYQTPEKLRKNAERDYGVCFEEAIEMAFENMQTDAREAVKGVREIKN